jgi:hypothetical protein
LKLSMIVRNDRRFFMYRPEKQKALLIQRLYTGDTTHGNAST